MAQFSSSIRKWSALVAGFCGLIALSFCALRFGSVSDLELSEVWALRLPRLLGAIAVGGALSLSGALLQASFANPLCDPYVLGISSGAVLGAIAFQAWGAGLNAGALAGCAAVLLLLLGFARRSQHSSASLLVVGALLNFTGQGVILLWNALVDPLHSQSVMSWFFGDFSRLGLREALFLLAVLTVGWGVAMRSASSWDFLYLGEHEAGAAHIAPIRLRRQALWISGVLTSLCVAQVGMIGFVGFLVPHLVRQGVTALHRWLLPLCVLWGACFLVGAEVLSRVLFPPYELPVGALVTLMGAPLLLWKILRSPAL